MYVSYSDAESPIQFQGRLMIFAALDLNVELFLVEITKLI